MMKQQDRHIELIYERGLNYGFLNRYVQLLTIPVCGLAFFVGVVTFFLDNKVVGIGATLYAVVSGFLYFFWKRIKNIQMWCRFYLTSWLMTVLVLSFLSGGMTSAITAAFVPIPLIAVVFLKRKEAVLWSLGLLSIVVQLFVASILNLVPPHDLSRLSLISSHFLLIFASGSVILVVGLVQSKQSDEKEELLNLEIQRRGKVESELVLQAKKISESNKELERFAVVAAHDLQEPLRMIGSYVQLISAKYKGHLDAEADEYIAFAVEGATKMKNQMNALLEYSRLSDCNFSVSPVNSKELVDRAIGNLRLLIKETHTCIECLGEFPNLNANPHQMTSIFQALIHNAIKFRSEKNPIVTISVQDRRNDFVFCIQDNGIGIGKRHHHSVFDLFQRLQSRRDYDGIGVGLTIAKKLVENHKGKIWIDSDDGVGSKFYFSISKLNSIKQENQAA